MLAMRICRVPVNSRVDALALPELPVFSILNLHFFRPTTTTTTTTTTTLPPAGKVTLCHKGKNTLSVSVNAVPAHRRRGDTLGPCNG
jgi:hypothetical protein